MRRVETLQEVKTRTPEEQAKSIANSTNEVRQALNKAHKKYKPNLQYSASKAKALRDMGTEGCFGNYID